MVKRLTEEQLNELAKEARREYGRERYKKNRERILSYQKEWRKKNPEKARAYQKKWRDNNKEYIKAYEQEYWRKKALEKLEEDTLRQEA